jgi:hypothetical protein
MQLREGPPAPLQLLDLVIQKLDSSSILLLGSLHMDLHPDYLNRVRQAAIKAESLGLIYLSERKEVRYRTGHLCNFCSLHRVKKNGTGQVIFVLSVVTKEKGRGVQDRSFLFFLFLPKGKGRGVQDMSSLYFLFLPKGKEEGYRKGHLCTFCSYQRDFYPGSIFFIPVAGLTRSRIRICINEFKYF